MKFNRCYEVVFLTCVAPFTGAWIEIPEKRLKMLGLESLPSRERGLKSSGSTTSTNHLPVAPFTGAWIEITELLFWKGFFVVAPFTGAWIEIISPKNVRPFSTVAPFTGAWIEISSSGSVYGFGGVAPFTGAWIEIRKATCSLVTSISRSLHGSVD